MKTRPRIPPTRVALLVIGSALPVGACLDDRQDDAPPEAASAPIQSLRFVDVTPESGLDFRDHHGRIGTAKRHIPETMGGGVALIDFDQDHDWDLVFVDGDPFDGAPPHPARAFRNDGGLRFTDVTRSVLGDLRVDGYGTAVGDVDRDGRDDLFIACRGRDRLLVQRDGRLKEIDALPRATANDDDDAGSWSTACALADLDGDGDLDLYIGEYVRFDDEARRVSDGGGSFRGHSVIAGPRGLPRGKERLLRNRWSEDGVLAFVDCTDESGLGRSAGYTLGVVADDFDQDGDIDLYVANDSDPNFLYQNNGDMVFRELGVAAEAALSGDGAAQAGMGVAVGDVDGDLRLDLFVTNFSHDANSLYLGQRPRVVASWRDLVTSASASASATTSPSAGALPAGALPAGALPPGGPGLDDDSWRDLHFLDATRRSGLFGASFGSLGFGCALIDADGDGDLDLLVANGHVFPNVDEFDLGTTYAQPDAALENDGAGRFKMLDAGMPVTARVSRAMAVGDLDGDGRPDLVITVQDGDARVLHNQSDGGNFAVLRLRPRENGSPVGAQLRARLDDGSERLLTCPAGGSYLSSSSPDFHVGLGVGGGAELLIRWPSGRVAALDRVTGGERWIVAEGQEEAPTALP